MIRHLLVRQLQLAFSSVLWRHGATHIVLTPMEFMRRLAALVPRPRLHLIRFHLEQCACGGKLKLIALSEEAAVIETIRKHIGLYPQPPPRAKAQRVDWFGAERCAAADGDDQDRGRGLACANARQ